MNPLQAGSNLGQIIFGAPQDQSAYVNQLGKAYSAKNSMEMARKNRADAIRIEGQNSAIPQLGDAATNAGLTPEQAMAYQILGQAGGGNAQQLISGLGDLARQGYSADARTAAVGGDLAGANANLFGLAKGPVDLTQITGDVAFNPLATPDQEFRATPVGLGDIALKDAQAGASRASASSNYAAANLRNVQAAAGGFSPGADGSGGGYGKAPSGYRYTESGELQFIPGGPADPAHRSGGSGQVVDNGDGTTTFIPSSKANSQERNNAGFYQRMVSADGELDALTDAGYDPTNIRDKLTVGGFANMLATSDGQQYNQAAQNWVRANLRKESGAAIGAAEMDQEIANYFPQIGDSKGVIDQKSRNRDVVEDAMKLAAGRALPSGPASLGEAMGAPPQPQPQHQNAAPMPTTDAEFAALPSGTVYTDPDDGKTYRKP